MQQFSTKLVTRSVAPGFDRQNSVTYQLTDRDEWMLLGGHMLATHDLFRSPDVIHSIHLNFHGGRNCWHVEREHWSKFNIYPREDHYGSLSEMMATFERLSGQTLQEVTVCALGDGISHFSAQGVRGGRLADPGNPWELEEGAIYRVDSSHRGEAPYITDYRAVLVGQGPTRRFELTLAKHPHDYPESFDPGLIMEMLIRGRGRGQLQKVTHEGAEMTDFSDQTGNYTQAVPAASPDEYRALLERWRAADGTAKSSDVDVSVRRLAAKAVEVVSDALQRSPFELDTQGKLVGRNMTSLAYSTAPALEVLVDIARTIGERRYTSGGDSRGDWRDMCSWADEFQAKFESNPDAGETYMEDIEAFAIAKAVDAGWSVIQDASVEQANPCESYSAPGM